MLVFVDRSGQPEAVACPVFLCDQCLAPIQGNQGGDRLGGIVLWRRHDDGSQVTATVHKGTCDRRYEATHGGADWSWEEIDVFVGHLAQNVSEPFPHEDNVEWVAPRPSMWRQGDRGPAELGEHSV